MPSARHRSSPMRPKSSLPMRAISATRAPWRAAAIAALLPLPPGVISNWLDASVSPRAIGRGTRDTRSAFQLAMQTTSATSLEAVAQLVRQPQDRLGEDRHQRERHDQDADEEPRLADHPLERHAGERIDDE